MTGRRRTATLAGLDDPARQRWLPPVIVLTVMVVLAAIAAVLFAWRTRAAT